MKRKDKSRSSQINRILIITGIIVTIAVLIFVSITIKNTDDLANYVNSIYTNAYSSTMDILEIRSGLQEIKTLVTEAVTNPTLPEEDVRLRLAEHRAANSRLAQEIGRRYNNKNIDDLLHEMAGLQTIHDHILDLLYSGRQEEAAAYLQERETPVYINIDNSLAALIKGGTENIREYVDNATALNTYTNNIAIILGMIAIILTMFACIYAAATISHRNAQLYQREVLFNIIMRNVDDVFMIYNMEQKSIDYISPNIERMYGLTAEEYMLEDNWNLGQSDVTDVFEMMENLYRETKADEIPEIEYDIRHLKTGEKKLLRTKMYPLFHQGGGLYLLICMTHDVTRDRQEQEILQSALESANAANKAKQEFVSRMSHEIRTPINAITGMRTIAESAIGNDAKVRECLRKIDVATQHLMGVVNDVLDLSRIESGKMKISYALFNLNTWAADTEILIQPVVAEKKISFRVDTADIRQPAVYGDAMRIRQVALNFLSNAIKFTPEQGAVTLSVSQGGETGEGVVTEFSVKDSGPGIREEFMDKIFTPFEQDDLTGRGKYGSGLGMSICKTLADLMGGEVLVRSKPGEGSEFILSVPLKGGKEEDAAPTEDRPDKFDFTGLRVLVAEDNEINMEIMHELLDTVGFEVEQAFDGRQAVAMFEAATAGYYDLIIMDIKMPVMDGYTAARRIRESGNAGNEALIIALTANRSGDNLTISSSDPMNAHLTKPVDPQKLFRTIRSLNEIKKGNERG